MTRSDEFVKVFVSADSTQKLRTMKGRTGLTPNILSRLAITLSLREPGLGDPNSYATDGMEFNRYTLLGQYDSIMMALVRERCIADGLEPDTDLGEQLRVHLNRGVEVLYPRLKSINDLVDLMPNPKDSEAIE